MCLSMCIMYIFWPGIMKLSWVDTEHSQDAGPVLVTGFTEKIAILTRVAPATPPGSEASDLERNILFEKTTLENPHLVSSASSNGPTLPLILSIQLCSVPEARAFTKNNLYGSHSTYLFLAEPISCLVTGSIWPPWMDSEQEDVSWRLSSGEILWAPPKAKLLTGHLIYLLPIYCAQFVLQIQISLDWCFFLKVAVVS